jgi:putative pyruvate formate lyase activating enzyme
MSRVTRRRFLEKSLCMTGSLLVFPDRPSSRKAVPMTSQTSRTRYPSFLNLAKNGILDQRAQELKAIYENCTLCPRDCRVDRTKKQLGKCQATATVKISSAFPHFGEERPLVGQKGSGTIFLSHCGLRCIYCQNYTLSMEGEGIEVPDERVAEAMLKLQKLGCHNINWVTPTHYMPSLVNALRMAVPMGLNIPVVYNTSGYERPENLQMLDGIVDIYLPDFKYWDPTMAGQYSSEAYNYPHYARLAFKEMFRQVGDLQKDGRGVARRGLMVRHLVLPNRVAGTREILKYIAGELSRTTYVNIMRQYRPEYRAREFKPIDRRISNSEYAEALGWAKEFGLTNLDR